MKGRDFKKLIENIGDDDEVVIAPVPDVSGHANNILPFLGTNTDGKTKVVVLGCTEGSWGSNGEYGEIDIQWPQRPV